MKKQFLRAATIFIGSKKGLNRITNWSSKLQL
jgi:hypothetical protein